MLTRARCGTFQISICLHNRHTAFYIMNSLVRVKHNVNNSYNIKGLIPYHIDCTLKTLTASQVKLIGLRIAAFPALPGLPSLNSDILERRGWEGKAYTAFYRMALVVFRGELTSNAMLCWYILTYSYNLIYLKLGGLIAVTFAT